MTRFIRFTLATAALALAAGNASALEPRMGVKLRALDKITGNSTDLTAKVGDTLKFGRLSVTVRACYASPPEDTPESAAFLEIHAATPVKKEGVKTTDLPGKVQRGPKVIGPDGLIFSGWMFASSPGLSALEHPTYDVWVISCSAASTSGPETSAPPAPPSTPAPN